MSVDDRLRAGLRANATSLEPQTERRLEDVHRRNRRRSTAVASLVAAAVLGVGGSVGWALGVGSSAPRGVDPAQRSSSVEPAHPVLPDSSWTKVVTRREAVRAGASRSWLVDNFGDGERLPLVLSFVGGVYSQSGRYPGGWAVGEAGMLSYDGDRVVLTSTSPGCRGCRTVLVWRISGDQLSLADRGGGLDPVDRLMLAGTWTRRDS